MAKKPAATKSRSKSKDSRADASTSGNEFKLLLNTTPPTSSSVLNASSSSAGTPVRRTPTRSSAASTPQRSATPTRSASSSSIQTRQSAKKCASSWKVCSYFQNCGYLRCGRRNVLAIVIASVLLIAFLILVNNKTFTNAVSDLLHSAQDFVLKTYAKKTA